jgi:hypothetical protein
MFKSIFNSLCDQHHCYKIATSVKTITQHVSEGLVIIEPHSERLQYFLANLLKFATILAPLGIKRIRILANDQIIDVYTDDLLRQIRDAEKIMSVAKQNTLTQDGV